MGLVGLIPARGGSKGIPRKNLALCGGKSLLAWAAESALGSGVLERVVLSTDDEEIAEAGRTLGLEAPFLRPAAIADDQAPMLGVMRHALDWLRADGTDVEGIVLLQPTSPFRTASHVREAVGRFRDTRAATLVTMMRVPHRFAPQSLMCETEEGLKPLVGELGPLRRQDKQLLWARNGPAVLIVRPEVLEAGMLYGMPTVGFEMDEIASIDIDTKEDLLLADFLLRNDWAGSLERHLSGRAE
ncbi:cytidylyltransferase domain-containing protein [Afifella sp. IM 167]|uniref:acylneuraminate cytidylyltransferase family protein n=1 Tax=Afifella sp. IM 167 TaxID=2033586 RepID=UPI001CCA75A7|nr:acylneuraminate cytidylyltransferase family protein [Afifella sp. IM 167]MBZ8134250.1 acylneuraminate cytidylyltransferase [Afifella sp. IM 167]